MARRPRKQDEPPAPSEVPAPVSLFGGGVLGQERALARLGEVIGSGRIHHAWVFHGPPGVGKFTTALAFAGIVLDPTSGPNLSGTIEPDPESRTRELLNSGSHPDLHVVNRTLAAHSRVSQVRGRKQVTIPREVLREFLLEPAARTRTIQNDSLVAKVFIVDGAELMNASSQNLLLKTLEEPPPGTLIILVTAHDDRLLPTIRSRCQNLAFGRLGPESMSEWMDRCDYEIDEEHRAWLLDYASGSPGVLQGALESGIYNWHTEVEPVLQSLDRGHFAPDAGPLIADLVKTWAEDWVGANPGASKEAANHAGAGLMLQLIANHYRRSLRHAAIEGRPTDHPLRAIDLVAGAEREIACNVQVPFVVENLAGQIAQQNVLLEA